MKNIPQQKPRPLKRKCPFPKCSEGGYVSMKQGNRARAFMANTHPATGFPKIKFRVLIKDYLFLKRLIKLVA